MKKCNKLAALALAALALSACCDQASIRGTLADGDGDLAGELHQAS